MKREEVARAINEDREVTYGSGKYRVCGYKVLKNLKGEKECFVILLDLKNMRTYIQVGINDV